MAAVSAYLAEQQRRTSGDIALQFSKLEELYNKKKWHQLTLGVHEFVQTPFFAQSPGRLKEMYDRFINEFEQRMNPLVFLEIIIFVLRDLRDPDESLRFLEKVKEKVKASPQAVILCHTVTGNLWIAKGDLDKVKKIIEETDVLLESLEGVTSVHSRYYELSSEYYRLRGDHAHYYREALRYLGCVTPEQEQAVGAAARRERALSLGLAALLGDGVYNFGELLAHPILDSLRGSDDSQWIVDLLYAFNSGSVAKFDALRQAWQKQSDLAAAEVKLRQKICLLCLMEMTFNRPANNRTLRFDEIASATGLPLDEVELLIMRALSLGLVRGSIDQVEQVVHMTWVQPRVLDLEQIGGMQKRLQQWCTDVKAMEMLVENKAHDILT